MADLYHIQVSCKGVVVSERMVKATDALAAINLVEAEYGEPPQVEYKTVQHEDGRKELMLVVSNWHGYSFVARTMRS